MTSENNLAREFLFLIVIVNNLARLFTICFASKDALGNLVGREVQNCKLKKFGALRKGPPFHGSRSSREIKIQNASCQMGGREVTR